MGLNVVVVTHVCLLSFAGAVCPSAGRSEASGSRAPPRVEEAPRDFPRRRLRTAVRFLEEDGGWVLVVGWGRRVWTAQLGVLIPRRGRGLGVEFPWGSWDAVPAELWGRGGVRGVLVRWRMRIATTILAEFREVVRNVGRGRGEWTWYRHAIEVVGRERACRAAVSVREEIVRALRSLGRPPPPVTPDQAWRRVEEAMDRGGAAEERVEWVDSDEEEGEEEEEKRRRRGG